jgi:Uma2 family endonuclease
MNAQSTATRRATEQRLRLSNIDWATYSRLLRVFAERPQVRLTYDRGELEIMSPLLEHDYDGDMLGEFVIIAADELRLPMMPGGSTTMRRRKQHKGLEADKCYWIANAARMTGRRRLDLRKDPPPDLAIEIDVSRSSLDRMGIYATLKVPEVWRLDGDDLTFQVLDEHGVYQPAPMSRSFPNLKPADLLPFLKEARIGGDQMPLLRRFRAWVRDHFATRRAEPVQ